MPANNIKYLSDESRYRLLTLLDNNPGLSQRELADALDISLGKTNYCIRTLIDRGWVKVDNYSTSGRKVGYLYKITPKGLSEKVRATKSFLIHRLREYKQLESEIAALKLEVEELNSSSESHY